MVWPRDQRRFGGHSDQCPYRHAVCVGWFGGVFVVVCGFEAEEACEVVPLEEGFYYCEVVALEHLDVFVDAVGDEDVF